MLGVIDQCRVARSRPLASGCLAFTVRMLDGSTSLLRSGLNQDGARTCRRLAQGSQNARTEFELPVTCGQTWDWRRACHWAARFEGHLIEGRVEFLGQDHGDRQYRALTHLDLRHDQRDLAVGVDSNECVRRDAGFSDCAPRAKGK